MTSIQKTETLVANSAADSDATRTKSLAGKMSRWELLCSVLAFAAPVTSVTSLIPFVIQGGGIGAPLTILAAMLLMLLFSIGFVKMSQKVSHPGAFYAYISEGCSRCIGQGGAFIAVFGYFSLGLCSIAILGPTIVGFMSDVMDISGVPWYAGSGIAIVATGVLSYMRIDLSAKVLTIAMLIEVLIVFIFNSAVPLKATSENLSLQPLNPSHFFDGNFTIAFLYSIIIFIGFESTAIYRDEVINPEKTIPFVTYTAVIFIGIFYAFSAWMTISAYGNATAVEIAKTDAANMFMIAMNNYFGKVGVDITKGILILSAFASLLSQHNTLSRYIYSLARNRAIPKLFANIHHEHKSPSAASIACTAAWSAAMVALSSSDSSTLYARLGGIGTYAVLILMSLTSLAVIIYFVKQRHITFKTFWCPLIAFVGLLSFTLLTTFNFQYLTGENSSDGLWLQALIAGMFMYGYISAKLQNNKRGPFMQVAN